MYPINLSIYLSDKSLAIHPPPYQLAEPDQVKCMSAAARFGVSFRVDPVGHGGLMYRSGERKRVRSNEIHYCDSFSCFSHLCIDAVGLSLWPCDFSSWRPDRSGFQQHTRLESLAWPTYSTAQSLVSFPRSLDGWHAPGRCFVTRSSWRFR